MAHKRVVFVPGFPASTLEDVATGARVFPPACRVLASNAARRRFLGRISGPDDPVAVDPRTRAGEPIRALLRFLGMDLGKQAQSLYDLLASLGYRVKAQEHVAPVGWDWRLPVDHVAVHDRLRAAFDRMHAESPEPVVVVAHSTGGLVLRAFLERAPAYARRIDHVIAIGVPWVGVLRTADYIGNGGDFDGVLLDPREGQAVVCRSWAAFDLLPPDPARTDLTDEYGAPLNLFVRRRADGDVQVAPALEQAWLRTLPTSVRDAALVRAARAHVQSGARARGFTYDGVALPVTNIVGWGARTETRGALHEDAGRWRLQVERGKDGDGTVPRRSAAWLQGPGVRTYHVPYGVYGESFASPHSQLWGAPPARQLLRQLLGHAPAAPYFWAALDPDDVEARRSPMRVRVVALDADGRPMPDATVHVNRKGTIYGPWALAPNGAVDLEVDRKMWWELDTSWMITMQLRRPGHAPLERDLGFWKL